MFHRSRAIAWAARDFVGARFAIVVFCAHGQTRSSAVMYRNATCATLWVPGPLPGMNEMIAAAKGMRGTGRLYSLMKREWTDKVADICRATGIDKPGPFDRRVILDFTWVEKDKRRDPDNVAAARKFVLDGLVQAGVLAGDGWKHIDAWRDNWRVDGLGCKGPGVGVSILVPSPTVTMD